MENTPETAEHAARVLMVDDAEDMCAMAGDYLRARGFAVECVADGAQGLQRAREGGWAMVILDVMLPGLDGFEVLRGLRAGSDAASQVPVVMLTAHGDETDRIVGLELGADDYLPKPFNPRELLARMRAVLRRVETERSASLALNVAAGSVPVAFSSASNALESSPPVSAVPLQVNDVELDARARTVRCAGVDVELTATEFDLLVYLMREAGRVVGRDELAREVLGRKLLSLDRSLDMHVLKVRSKLGPLPNGGERLKTVRGVGYVFVKDEG